ncbi:hypothetical protein GCM10022267_74980 [Lentzea roselyniae]|uniref:Uncharacterized protein n=1 Tax=Lentzea roselyniae TaxID=531940 RepID=A0ABP7C6G3_9PSEU
MTGTIELPLGGIVGRSATFERCRTTAIGLGGSAVTGGSGAMVLGVAAAACRRLLVCLRCSFVRRSSPAETLPQPLLRLSRMSSSLAQSTDGRLDVGAR